MVQANDWYTDTNFVVSTITDDRDTEDLGRRLRDLPPLDFSIVDDEPIDEDPRED